MKKQTASMVAFVVMMVAAPVLALADGGGWTMPNLNPFAQKGKPPTTNRSASAGGWQWPKLWSSNSAAKSKSKKPSAMQSVTKGTKQFFSKTADAFNPWDD